MYWRQKAEAPAPGDYGFIVDDAAPEKREANVWFGPKSLQGLKNYKPKSGDRVEFKISECFKPGRGPQAERIIKLCDDDDDREVITTLGGEL